MACLPPSTGPHALVDKVKSDDKVEGDDVAIPMDQTYDASKLGRQVVPGESSSSSSSSSSDDQAEHVYSGMSAHPSAHVRLLLHHAVVTPVWCWHAELRWVVCLEQRPCLLGAAI